MPKKKPEDMQQRLSVTLHFIVGKDDKLIAKISKWTKGDRSHNLKMMLLGQLDKIKDQSQQNKNDLDVKFVHDALLYLQDRVEKFPEILSEALENISIQQAPRSTPKSARNKGSSREENMKKNTAWDDDDG